jgi:PAS domain S-box-containing protein
LAPTADVLILTGFADVDGAITALRQGVSDYLLKPVNPDELRARVARLAEYRRAEQELQQRSLILQSVLKQVPDAATVVDRNGRVLLHSPGVERLIGPIQVGDSLDDLQTRRQIYRPDTITPYQREELPLSRALRGEEVVDEEIFAKPTGQFAGRWLSASATPLRNSEGLQGAVVIVRDITERKEAQERALQAERLATIGEMITGLAHESGNALQRSQSCLEMLALEVEDRPHALDLIARLQKAQQDLCHIYNDVRNYAAPIHLERRDSDLAEIWRAAWKDLEPIRKGRVAEIRETIKTPDMRCRIDPFRIGQVFRNLLENALAACPDPVSINVRCEAAEQGAEPMLRVSVKDNGAGLSPEAARMAFEAFYTTKTKGTGLGLAISKRIVEAHGGRLSLNDHSGRGAEFILDLPRGHR